MSTAQRITVPGNAANARVTLIFSPPACVTITASSRDAHVAFATGDLTELRVRNSFASPLIWLGSAAFSVTPGGITQIQNWIDGLLGQTTTLLPAPISAEAICA